MSVVGHLLPVFGLYSRDELIEAPASAADSGNTSPGRCCAAADADAADDWISATLIARVY